MVLEVGLSFGIKNGPFLACWGVVGVSISFFFCCDLVGCLHWILGVVIGLVWLGDYA